MHECRRIPLDNFFLRSVVVLSFGAVASLADLESSHQPPPRDGCLLQQRSESQRSAHAIHEEPQQIKKAPAALGKVAPSSGSISLLGMKQSPTSDPKSESHSNRKSSPKSGAKKPATPVKETWTSTTRPPKRIQNTKVEDIVDTDLMTQRGELHLKVGLDKLQENYGSLSQFVEFMKAELLTRMKNLDPKRLVLIGVRGDYLDADSDNPHVTRQGTQIDFEVYPGPADQPTPAHFLKVLTRIISEAEKGADRADWRKSPLHAEFEGARIRVDQGSKQWGPPSGGEMTEDTTFDKDINAGLGATGWYPWDWYKWLWQVKSSAQMPSSQMLVLPLILLIQAAVEM